MFRRLNLEGLPGRQGGLGVGSDGWGMRCGGLILRERLPGNSRCGAGYCERLFSFLGGDFGEGGY